MGEKARLAGTYLDPERLGDCRLLLLWPDAPDLVETLAESNHILRRILVLRVPSEKDVRYTNPKIRTVVLGDENDVKSVLLPALEQEFVYIAEGKVRVELAPVRRRSHPQLCDAIENHILLHVRAALGLVALRATRGWHMLMNMIVNMPRAVEDQNVGDLSNACAGLPVIIVGAGPSLDDSVSALAAYQGKAVLIACDGALNTLDVAGVVPDIVVAIDDSERVWRHFASVGAKLREIPMACLLQTAWPAIRYHRGPVYVGGTGKAAERLISGTSRPLPVFDTGLCVGHAALELAALMGASRIVMAGFDLSFDGVKSHPKHHAVPYYDDQPPLPEQRTTVEGNDGAARVTDWSMMLYLREFERRILKLGIAVANASESGARIVGAPFETLADSMSRLPDIRKPVFSRKSAGREMCDRLRKRRGELASSLMAMSGLIRKSLVKENPVAGCGADPFPFLDTCRSVADMLVEMENPAVIAGFRLAWEDWIGNGAPMNCEAESVTRMARQVLQLLDRDCELFAALLSPGDIDVGKRFALRRAIAIVGKGELEAGWVKFIQDWKETGWEVELWSGEIDDITGIWRQIEANSIAMILSLNGSVFPATWAVPFCGCVDLRLHPPSGPSFREAWLPGYIVMANDPVVCAAWRRMVPSDIPVILNNHFDSQQSHLSALARAVELMQRELFGPAWHGQC